MNDEHVNEDTPFHRPNTVTVHSPLCRCKKCLVRYHLLAHSLLMFDFKDIDDFTDIIEATAPINDDVENVVSCGSIYCGNSSGFVVSMRYIMSLSFYIDDGHDHQTPTVTVRAEIIYYGEDRDSTYAIFTYDLTRDKALAEKVRDIIFADQLHRTMQSYVAVTHMVAPYNDCGCKQCASLYPPPHDTAIADEIKEAFHWFQFYRVYKGRDWNYIMLPNKITGAIDVAVGVYGPYTHEATGLEPSTFAAVMRAIGFRDIHWRGPPPPLSGFQRFFVRDGVGDGGDNDNGGGA